MEQNLGVEDPLASESLQSYFRKIDDIPWLVVSAQSMKLEGYSGIFASLYPNKISLSTPLGSLLSNDSIFRLSKAELSPVVPKEIRLELILNNELQALDFNVCKHKSFVILKADYMQYCTFQMKLLKKQFKDNQTKLTQIHAVLAKSEYHIIWTLDDNHFIRDVTEAGLKNHLGYSPNVVVGKDFKHYMQPEYVDQFITCLKQLQESDGTWTTFNYSRLNYQGKEVQSQACLQRHIDDKGVTSWLVVDTFQSPTLQTMLENMTHKVVASVAHDIKQPCNVITNSIGIIEANLQNIKEVKSPSNGNADPSNQRQADYSDGFVEVYLNMRNVLAMVNRETWHFSSLVDDFLVYENCRVKPDFISKSKQEEFEMTLALQNLVLESQLKEDLVEIQVELGQEKIFCIGPKFLLVDKAVGILLNSAITYVVNESVDPTVTVRFQAISMEDTHGFFEIEVNDNAPLIDDHSGFIDFESKSISEPSEIAKRRRIGVGYHLCKRIAEAHSGTFEIYGDVNEGTSAKITFKLTLSKPRTEKALPRGIDDPEIASMVETKGIKILFADDVYTQRRMMEMMFKLEKIEYDLVSDGVEVVEKIIHQKKEFDVVIIDYQMIEMDGPETVRQLRRSGYKGYIIGMTGISSVVDEENFLNAGVDEIKSKPLDIRIVLKELAEKFKPKVGS